MTNKVVEVERASGRASESENRFGLAVRTERTPLWLLLSQLTLCVSVFVCECVCVCVCLRPRLQLNTIPLRSAPLAQQFIGTVRKKSASVVTYSPLESRCTKTIAKELKLPKTHIYAATCNQLWKLGYLHIYCGEIMFNRHSPSLTRQMLAHSTHPRPAQRRPSCRWQGATTIGSGGNRACTVEGVH